MIILEEAPIAVQAASDSDDGLCHIFTFCCNRILCSGTTHTDAECLSGIDNRTDPSACRYCGNPSCQACLMVDFEEETEISLFGQYVCRYCGSTVSYQIVE